MKNQSDEGFEAKRGKKNIFILISTSQALVVMSQQRYVKYDLILNLHLGLEFPNCGQEFGRGVR